MFKPYAGFCGGFVHRIKLFKGDRVGLISQVVYRGTSVFPGVFRYHFLDRGYRHFHLSYVFRVKTETSRSSNHMEYVYKEISERMSILSVYSLVPELLYFVVIISEV